MIKDISLIILVLIVHLSQAHAFLEISCVGEGPSLALARKRALADCMSSAAERLKTDFRVKSVVVQTETDSALHDELLAKQEVSGLVCANPKETITELFNSFRVSLACQFDPSKAKFENLESNTEGEIKVGNKALLLEGSKLIDTDAGISVSIASIPLCDSILITSSSKPQIVRCAANPVRIVLHKNDDEVIVRKNSYKPQTLKAEILRSKPNGQIQIIFDN